ncbi:hypothetical protein ACLOJK_037761 [Asimina triloba]
MLPNGVAERTFRSITHPGTTPTRARLTTNGDGSGENLVVKRARVGVVPRWVTERDVLSATPLGSIEARGNGGRRPVHSSGDGSGENLVVKRAQVGVVPGWVTEREILSATPLGSIEARGNGGRRPVGLGHLGFRCAGTNP